MKKVYGIGLRSDNAVGIYDEKAVTPNKSDGLLHGKSPVRRNGHHLSVEIGVVGFGFFEDGVDRGQQHPANGNDSFVVPTTLFERKITAFDFRVLV